MENKSKNDPDNYFKLSTPHEGPQAADEAMEKFYNEIGELRKKYKIRDVSIIVYDSIKYEDGKTGEFMNVFGYGNSLNQLPMVAFAFGQEQKSHMERINKIISGEK